MTTPVVDNKQEPAFLAATTLQSIETWTKVESAPISTENLAGTSKATTSATRKAAQRIEQKSDSNKRVLKCGRPMPVRRSLTESDLLAIRDRLERYLRDRGQRFTEPRWKVAEAIIESGLHLDSREILAAVKKRDPKVGEATVYRAIHLLCAAKVLEESHQTADGRSVYEICDEDHHDHIVCLDCGETFEFHDEALEELQDKMARNRGFQLAGHHHVLMAHCQFFNSPSAKREAR